MEHKPDLVRPEVRKMYWRSHFTFAAISLIPLCCLGLLFFFSVFPEAAGGGRAIAYGAAVILGLVFLLSILGYFVSLRNFRSYGDASQDPTRPFAYFAKVYILVSLIPLLCISLLLFIYIVPGLIRDQNYQLLFAIIGIVALSFLLSILGYVMTRRDLTGTFQTIQSSKNQLDDLVKLSTSISEVNNIDEVYDRIVQGARELVKVSGVYVFTRDNKGWVFRHQAGNEWSDFGPEATRFLEEARDQVYQGKKVLCFEGGPLARYFPDVRDTVQVLGAPLVFEDRCHGAIIMVNKETEAAAFRQADTDIIESLAMQAAISLDHAEFRETQINYFTHTIELLVLSMEGSLVPRDHLRNVARYAGIISRELNIPEDERRKIYFAALLHDVGMIKIRPEMHALPEHYKLHPIIGAEMIGRIVLWNDLVPIIRGHHENYDGSGYPDGLAGEAIPASARIIYIAESFDAMTNPNSYRSLLSYEAALDELKHYAGVRYDPRMVELFARHLGEHMLDG